MVSTEAPARPPSPPRPQSGPSPRTVLLIGGVILLAIVILAVQAAIVYRATHPGGRRANHVVTGPLSGRHAATLDLVSGVTSVTVRGAALGDHLYRIATPDDARVVPSIVDAKDAVQVQLADAGRAGPSAIAIELNRDVRWDVRFTAGSTTVTADLRDVALSGVAFIGGVSAIDLRLPRPDGTVPVRMAGGASQFTIHAPDGVPVRVRLGGGAGSATLDGSTRSGISAGTVLTPDGWDGARDRYDVDNTAGVSTVTVDRS